MNTNCVRCGRRVPREGKVTRIRYPSPGRVEPNPHAGRPAVSGDMRHIDPNGFFCSMRCAAWYAVADVVARLKL